MKQTVRLSLKQRVAIYPIPVLLGQLTKRKGELGEKMYREAIGYVLANGHNTYTVYNHIRGVAPKERQILLYIHQLFGIEHIQTLDNK